MTPYAHALCALVCFAESDAHNYKWPQTPADRKEAVRLWNLGNKASDKAGPDACARAWRFLYSEAKE